MANPMFVPDAQQIESAQQLEAMVKRPKKRKSRSVGPSKWDKAVASAGERRASGEWEGAEPIEFVALYAALHEHVYGVVPGELTSSGRFQATMMATRLLRDEFAGDASALAEMIRWTWARERKNEQWRRQNKQQGKRIGPGFQFSGASITNWKLGVAREQGK